MHVPRPQGPGPNPYLAWVGARLIAFERVTAEQRDQLGAFHVAAEVQECDCDLLLVCGKATKGGRRSARSFQSRRFVLGIQFSFFKRALFL
jgi:hypothetical protein